MIESYYLSIRFRAQGATMVLDLEPDGWLNDLAIFTPPLLRRQDTSGENALCTNGLAVP